MNSAPLLTKRRQCPAFTLVELLVVIAIIGIPVALLLPAVQAAREAARRSQCTNNLKQLALGSLNHESTRNRYPTAVSYNTPAPAYPGPVCDTTGMPSCSGTGWIVNVLPFVEEQSLYDTFTPCRQGSFFAGGGMSKPICRTPLATQLGVLQCPSDESVLNLGIWQPQLQSVGVTQEAKTSYKGVAGDNKMAASAFPGSTPDCQNSFNCTGMLWRHNYLQPRRVKNITDGTSKTLLIGEDIPLYAPTTSAAYFANGDHAFCYIPLNYKPTPINPSQYYNNMGFRSNHGNVVQFALCDGSVAALGETIDHDIYRALSTIAVGETAAVP